jgi:hypothetical protein
MQGSDLAAAVEALRESVAELEERHNDLVLKTEIMSSQLIGTSGLDRFFGEPEFWEKVYNSGRADCAGRCIKQAAEHRKACAEIEDPDERLACYEEAARNAAACQQQCAEQFG